MTALVKRETGENPVRTRRCKEGVLFEKPLRYHALGRQNKVSISKSEDLPEVVM